MKVFISYSRKDEVVAHFLSFILVSQGVTVLIDRKFNAGDPIGKEIQSNIERADIVLLLLTRNAARSVWVNQEIGFATAKGKKIWPISLERELNPEGLISSLLSYSLFDWSEPHRAIDKLVSQLVPGGMDSGLDLVINNRLARTKFLVEKLCDLQDSGKSLTIYHQAAFSVFAASLHPEYRVAGIHNDEYLNSLMQEREKLDKIARNPNTDFRMILWPVRAYDPEYLARRYRTLLEWLEEMKRNHPNVKVIVGRYSGANKLIVRGEFIFEGYKIHDRPGYDSSVYRVSPRAVDAAAQDFESKWNELQEDGQDPIMTVKRLLDETNRPNMPLTS